MVMRFGMSELGPVTLEQETRNPYETSDLSDEMSAKVDEQVKKDPGCRL